MIAWYAHSNEGESSVPWGTPLQKESSLEIQWAIVNLLLQVRSAPWLELWRKIALLY